MRRAWNRVPDRLVKRMHADYQRGLSFAEVGERYPHSGMAARPCLDLEFVRVARAPVRKRTMPTGPKANRWTPDELVQAMHRDYWEGGMTLRAVARKHGRKPFVDLRQIFARRGLPLRPSTLKARRTDRRGRLLPEPEPTAAEIKAVIERLDKVKIPEGLKWLWKRWDLTRRSNFIRQMRRSLARRGLLDPATEPPARPYSANVEPFDYTSAPAHAIAARLNAGLDSRHFVVKIDLCSRGVIYRERLFFWSRHSGPAYFSQGGWRPEIGRPPLHRLIWEEHHGAVPEGMTVIQLDGNKNNLDPANLGLRSRAECARQNSIWRRLKQHPEDPVIQEIARRRRAKIVATRLAHGREAARALLNVFNSGQPSLAAQLRRKT